MRDLLDRWVNLEPSIVETGFFDTGQTRGWHLADRRENRYIGYIDSSEINFYLPRHEAGNLQIALQENIAKHGWNWSIITQGNGAYGAAVIATDDRHTQAERNCPAEALLQAYLDMLDYDNE